MLVPSASRRGLAVRVVSRIATTVPEVGSTSRAAHRRFLKPTRTSISIHHFLLVSPKGEIKRPSLAIFGCPPHLMTKIYTRRTPSCFVDFIAEVFSPLLAGVPVLLPPAGASSDTLRLVPALSEARATRITLTPSLLSSIIRTGNPSDGPLLPSVHVR